MKRTLAGGFVVLVACGSDPPPQAVMVPAASSEVPAPAPTPPTVATGAPTAVPEPAPSASVAEPAPSSSATGQGFGSGSGGRLSTPGGKTSAPSIRQGATQVTGRLPPEVIQRIVRQNFGRFRLCYENGLATDPKLEGKVVVKFTIDKGGAVVGPADGGSTITDAAMVSCVVKGFGNLSFPQPESGTVSVVYPILFAPGN